MLPVRGLIKQGASPVDTNPEGHHNAEHPADRVAAVTDQAGWIAAVRQALDSTGVLRNSIFRNLWGKQALSFGAKKPLVDGVTSTAAAAVSAAIHRSRTLLVVLPDREQRRPPLLFASALIVDALSNTRSAPGTVLYVGTNVEIRQQLASVKAGRWFSLDTVFRQERASGKGATVRSENKLPVVVTSTAPSEAGALLQRVCPDWIALDGSDAIELRWLTNLLSRARERRIPVVGWCQNALSDQLRAFRAVGAEVLQLPSSQPLVGAASDYAYDVTTVSGEEAKSVEQHLAAAYRLLSSTHSTTPRPRLVRDALRVAWGQLRRLATLHIPLDLYEREVENHWGLQTVAHGQDAIGAFASAIQPADSSLASKLIACASHLDAAIAELLRVGPPHWHSLVHWCMESTSEDANARVVLFGSQARKELFAFSLLASHDISASDLDDVGIALLSGSEFYGRGRRPWLGHSERAELDKPAAILASPSPDSWRLIVPEIPSTRMLARLEPAMQQQLNLHFVVYPYQLGSLTRRLSACAVLLGVPADATAAALASIGASVSADDIPSSDCKIAVGTSNAYEVSDSGGVRQSVAPPPEPPRIDTTAEAVALFRIASEDSANDREVMAVLSSDEVGDELTQLFADSAVAIEFEEGWSGLFEPDALVTVILPANAGLERRPVRSLSAGDQGVFIHGQRRQNLYELIIRRVHDHQAFALHVSLVSRWQEAVSAGYAVWKVATTPQRVFGDLLDQLRVRGSSITTTGTICGWVRGYRLCPDDPEDLERLADVLSLPFVKNHYREIAAAAKQLRSKHKSWGRRLTQWLLAGIHSKRPSEMFDVDLDLSYGDLQGSVLHLTVATVTELGGPIYRERLGDIRLSGDKT